LNRKSKKSTITLKWNRVLLFSFAIVLLVVISVVFFQSDHNTVATDESFAPPAVSFSDYFETREKWLLDHKRIRECFRKGETFYELLAHYGLPAQAIMRIDEVVKPLFDLSRTKAGQIIDIWINAQSEAVEKISLHLSPEKILHVIRNGHEFFPSLVSPEKISIPTEISGSVATSFYESALERGLPSDVIMAIADIFAWDIDFLVDIRPGDSFQVILRRYYRKGKSIGLDEVLAVRFVNQNRVHKSFYFIDSQGREGYYDRKGKSLEKAFLKSPLRYRRISSYFSSRRFHPILKIYRPHYGIDYAAPVGTPVESVGDGRVTFIGWKNGYGRYIKVRHNRTYVTGYGHLNRFAKGLKKGSRVRQGNVIGYVGSSGLATGPHLDFSLMKNGRYVNPLSVQSPPAFILRGKDRQRFHERVIQMEEVWQKNQTS
jgi:murein DD-endopeptidase MepM/ murein hydrolase activator NlpD